MRDFMTFTLSGTGSRFFARVLQYWVNFVSSRTGSDEGCHFSPKISLKLSSCQPLL